MDIPTAIPYYYDPHFPVCEIPQWRANFYKFLSVKVWGNLPSDMQRKLSAAYASYYDKPFSKWVIKPYVRFYYKDKNYLGKFKPPHGKSEFESFQDFFIREFKRPVRNEDPWTWPCEGLLCEQGTVDSIKNVKVKADERTVCTIFGVPEGNIPGNYSFSNVFLHNKNYHRIHSPINGTIARVQNVPGDLVVLRPWIYKQNPSLPAFRNERYNIDIVDSFGRTWFVSIIGGPAVGTIELSENIKVGSEIGKIEEIALFYLGSTCCIASPIAPKYHRKNTFVEVGASY